MVFEQIGEIEMGMFSWIAADTGTSISNCESAYGALPVYMHDDKGNVWFEAEYEGYGVFGGKDYFELLAEMNGLEGREAAIDLECDIIRKAAGLFSSAELLKEVKFPNLTEEKEWKWVNAIPKDCPDQGYFY